MQPCAELKNLALQHYGEFSSGGQLDSVRDTYSRAEGVANIGNDPKEWFDDPHSIVRFIESAGDAKLDINVDNINA